MILTLVGNYLHSRSVAHGTMQFTIQEDKDPDDL